MATYIMQGDGVWIHNHIPSSYKVMVWYGCPLPFVTKLSWPFHHDPSVHTSPMLLSPRVFRVEGILNGYKKAWPERLVRHKFMVVFFFVYYVLWGYDKGCKRAMEPEAKEEKRQMQWILCECSGSLNEFGRQFSWVYVSVFKKHSKIHHMPCDN